MKIEKFWRNSSEMAASIAMIATLISAIVATGFLKDTSDISDSFVVINKYTVEDKIIKTNNEIIAELASLKKQYQALIKLPKDSKVNAQILGFKFQLEKLETQMKTINNVILQSPEKALEIPMLKKDITVLKAQYEKSNLALQREITRAYETMKWVIGTIILGLLGLGASVFLREK